MFKRKKLCGIGWSDRSGLWVIPSISNCGLENNRGVGQAVNNHFCGLIQASAGRKGGQTHPEYPSTSSERENCTTTFVAVIPEATHYKKTPEKAHASQIRGV